VIAVSDGRILKVGTSRKLGRYIQLQDATGNVYTYSNLGTIPKLYAVPRPAPPTRGQLAAELLLPEATGGSVTNAASAGLQPGETIGTTGATGTTGAIWAALSDQASAAAIDAAVRPVAAVRASRRASGSPSSTGSSAASEASQSAAAVAALDALVKERLFADPVRSGSYEAGGAQQLLAISSFKNYFSDALHLSKNQYTLAPLVKGSIVVAGTILGRVGADALTKASHLYFQIQPAGKNAPLIDPKPILDGWKLLQATAIYRANGRIWK
jgi:hypothetical protein